MIWSTWGRRLVALPGVTAFTSFVGLGTAAFKNTGTSGNTVPLLDGANTWSAGQTFESTAAGAGINPLVKLYRNVAVTGYIGELQFEGRDSAGNRTIYAGVNAFITDNTNGSESASLDFWTIRSGAYTEEGFFNGGFVVGTPTGSANGFGSINCQSLYVNDGLVGPPTAPATKTANFTVADSEHDLINNKSGSSCTVTLPTPSTWPGRELYFKNLQAQTVVSASSNVVPLGTAVAGTAILSANAGRWCRMVSNGTNWVIMAGVI